MSIPLRTATCATALALVMVPGIAEAGSAAAEPPDRPHAARSERTAGEPHRATPRRATPHKATPHKAVPRKAERRRTLHHRGVRAESRAALLASAQRAAKRKRARMTARWERRASRAVRFALDQRGRPYVWGGTGRRGFDCSGLVQQAWRHAGVSIPRVTSAQYSRIRTRVARSRLRPGDLVFFEGRSHVGLYLGGDRFVHAPRPGRDVTVQRLQGRYASGYAGAVRPGWKPLPPVPTTV